MDKRLPSPFHGNISFNAQHAPQGAFFSFTCGQFGSTGGFGLQIGRPGNQELFIAVKDGPRTNDSTLRALPFYKGAVSTEAERFDVEKKSNDNKPPKMLCYPAEQIKRHYGWATDRWETPDFSFAIYTPFFPAADPEKTRSKSAALSLLPAIVAEMTIDNTNGKIEKTGLFAIRFADAGARQLDGGQLGFAWRNQMGCQAEIDGPADACSVQRWEPASACRNKNPVHLLGSCPGIAFTVAAGKKATLRLSLGVYLAGAVTTGIQGVYQYTRYWKSLEDVLAGGLDHFTALRKRAIQLDSTLAKQKLNADQKFIIAHATRSYYGSTQLLRVKNKPFWIVNEGEYCMMNTLDLSVDHVFWELQHNPWVVRNLLDHFVKHYSYVDRVKVPRSDGEYDLKPGGISFCHDMGVHNNFSPCGDSSYEVPDLTGCFSYMTAEQLCNWSLMAGCYVHATADLRWLKANRAIIEKCLASMINRGGDAGFCQYDSSRCKSGAEITTYDSLDHSLAQTRNNVYMAVKSWATYKALEMLLGKLKSKRAADAADGAARIEKTVLANVGADGILPAVFEKDNPGHLSRILPAIEGLIYPWFWKDPSLRQSRALIDVLRQHTIQLLTSGSNVLADGGIKLSSTSNNSWMSKIAIFVHVCNEILGLKNDKSIQEIFTRADAAHTKWQTEGDSAYWACSDQIVSGVAKGSKYYPRIITAALWMKP